MSPLRIVLLAAAALVLAAPLASAAAPAGESSSACAAARMTGVERRISEEAARGQLIGFVNLTQPIYQLRLGRCMPAPRSLSPSGTSRWRA